MYILSESTYIVNNDTFETARQKAKQRAANQWLSDNFNLWIEYNTTLNTSWVDPWHEHEIGGIYNEAPEWEQTQNAYFCYCWFKSKGYADYALTGILSTFLHESSLTGGAWEGGYHPYAGNVEYSSLIGYTAEDTNANYYNQTWYTSGGGLVPAWTAETTDEVTGLDYTLTAPAGSFDALKGWPIATYQDEQGRNRPYIPLRFNRNGTPARYRGAGGGYGLAQWTLWTKLPTLAAHFGTDAPRHWQINPTLQLMILEYQRELSRTGQSGGEWSDADASHAVLIVGANRISYGSSMTWEYFISDQWTLWVEAQFERIGITDQAQIEWGKRQFAIALWGACYEHGGEYDYASIGFPQISLYLYSAIRYWETNGGYDIQDVPRARDIENCELDNYHVTFPMMVQLIGRRRKKHHVTTIFL